ncbi:M50 family metallopeptidase [Pseudosporangium ferrugineum]|uniref:Peptidase M50B-like protein n=1 Tax=Pseudosporangium ferrugineum TaxID=439699 RepID=A0A2T0S4W0_9ACTN|nr:M50 family metallopeptidase [Pseudosporangium ferrugineum]PRY28333.1 peptidase M50B-like protein [Pseudosporangium ferrugineum]
MGMAWSTAVVAFVGAVPLWRYTTNVITVAHEGGHAVFGWLFGSVVKHVKIFHAGSGEMLSGRENWFSAFVSLVAGYLGPSLFGYAGVQLLIHDFDPRSVLFLSLVFLAGVLIMVRTLFGVFVILATGAVLWVVAMRSTEAVQLAFAYVWVWFLLMGGVRQVPELFRAMRADEVTDAGLLQRHTLVGDVVWLFLFWLLSLAALVYGGALLLRH